MDALARALPEAHALVACQDGSLLCVDARAGRLIRRLASACGAPSGASGAAVEVSLGSLMMDLQGHQSPHTHCLPDTGSSGGRQDAAGGISEPLPCPADAASVSGAAHARLALCSVRGTLAVLQWPSASVVAGAQLPAESFSAPVVFDGRIVLGCRDDHLYCLTWR